MSNFRFIDEEHFYGNIKLEIAYQLKRIADELAKKNNSGEI